MNALQFPNTQIPLFGDETDDVMFLETVRDIVDGMLLETKVAGISLVNIRDWFGPKWLGFSGKKMGMIGVHSSRLTIPPFHPHRVLSQRFYVFNPDSLAYEKSWPPFRLHIQQPSEQNTNRLFNNFIASGALVWVSSDSARTRNGALMIYVTRHRQILCGYLDLTRLKNGEWSARSYSMVGRQIPLELFESWSEAGRLARLDSQE